MLVGAETVGTTQTSGGLPLPALPKARREGEGGEGKEGMASLTPSELRSTEQRHRGRRKPSRVHRQVSSHTWGRMHRPTPVCLSAEI